MKPDTTSEALAALRPAFQEDGMVTAGNSAGLTDGASALVVTSRAYAEAHGLPVLAAVREYAAAHREPQDVFFAPIDVVRKVMEKGGYRIGDFDLIEANEAFAAQCVADGKGAGMGPGAGQRQRWGDRARAPHRRQWCADPDHAPLCHAGAGGAARAGDTVLGRRRGRGFGGGT